MGQLSLTIGTRPRSIEFCEDAALTGFDLVFGISAFASSVMQQSSWTMCLYSGCFAHQRTKVLNGCSF